MVDKVTNKYVKKLLMQNPDGSEFHGHAGGLTVHGDYIYVAGSGDSCLYVFNYEDAIKASDGDIIKSIGTFPMPDDMSVAYTSSDEDVIYAGEFFREENYKTDDTHKMTTAAGDYNQALMFAYHFSNDEDALFGIEPEPFEVYSITDLVQGMDTYNGQIYLSTSYGVAFSHIYVYDKPESMKNLEIAGLTLPLYELDSSVLRKDFKYAPMSEEIVCVDDRVIMPDETQEFSREVVEAHTVKGLEEIGLITIIDDEPKKEKPVEVKTEKAVDAEAPKKPAQKKTTAKSKKAE